MDDEKCDRCGDLGEDRRTLSMRCFYDMSELKLPFVRAGDGLFTLRVCKNCRGDWLAAIKLWFDEFPKVKTSCGSGIFVRRNGANVEITEEEWSTLNPGREPVRYRP